MLINSETAPSTLIDSNIEDDSTTVTSAPNATSNEPIKIILFPPKDKQFCYDEQSNSFQVQSLPTTKFAIDANLGGETSDLQRNLTPEQSTLTPLIEKCNLLTEERDFDGFRQQSQSDLNWCDTIREVLKIENAFNQSKLRKNCFLKGCKWSPDGLCLLSNSDDNFLRLFEISENLIKNPHDVQPVLQMKEGGTIYDFEWYPGMNSSDPISCVFVSASQDAPIHLWDAYTGCLRATYQPINQFDEVTAAYSVAFSPDGSKLYSGHKKYLRVFNTSQPGRISEERLLKTKGNPIFQTNLVSTICVNTVMQGLYAVGCYDKTIGVYAEPEGDLLFILKGHSGGITQVKFSADGNYLYSGGRKDSEILCWDMRNPGKVVFSIVRQVDTQQKIQFDLSPNEAYLITGTTDCNLKIYNLKNPSNSQNVLDPVKTWRGHEDCVNGVQFHPKVSLFASASGQRHFSMLLSDDDDIDEDVDDGKQEKKHEDLAENKSTLENSIKIWTFDNP